MLIKNGRIHDGKGKIFESDIRIEKGKILKIGKDLKAGKNEEVVNAKGLEVFPGFIQTLSSWGINGSATEIRPSSDDNDELSDPITPQLNVKYAFNGRAATVQQLGAFGLTTIGVTPTDNNLFGGTMAVFEVDGLNPFEMLIKDEIGMKASVRKNVKMIYGKRNAAPQTKMWLFEQLGEQFRKASEYKIEKGKERDMKMEALQKVLKKKMPLFLSVDTKQDALHALEILKPYRIKLVLCNGYEIDENAKWLLDKKIPLVVRSNAMTMDETAMKLDLKGIAALSEKGLKVALSGVDSHWQIREDVLWLGINMMRILKDEKKVLPMMTSIPAEILSVSDVTGSIEEGKRADIVLWKNNPLESYQAEIITTYMGGKAIYRKGDELRCM
ncbi:MAG: amidohydrolase family protein [Erysipelotrichaceae bacterium]|nr:amidohydrolase family protein [Erysipelotrichaceae bacterium]